MQARAGKNPMRHAVLSAIAALRAGCVSTTDPDAQFSAVRRTDMGGGQFMVSCVDSPNYCGNLARQTCPAGFDTSNITGQAIGNQRMTMVIRCRP